MRGIDLRRSPIVVDRYKDGSDSNRLVRDVVVRSQARQRTRPSPSRASRGTTQLLGGSRVTIVEPIVDGPVQLA
jgi:hypothetical protein